MEISTALWAVRLGKDFTFFYCMYVYVVKMGCIHLCDPM